MTTSGRATTTFTRPDRTIEVEVLGWYAITVDRNYGADRDGNRGVAATFCDLERWEVYDKEGMELHAADLLPEEWEEVQHLLDTKVQEDALEEFAWGCDDEGL